MHRASGNKLLLGLFAALAVSSVGLKAMAGPARNGTLDRPGEVTSQISALLQSQGFSTTVRSRRIQSSIVDAVRGACRLSVRDARNADGAEIVFAQDAVGIGPVRYLYRGRTYGSPPVLAIRLARAETAVLGLMSREQEVPLPLALATSSGCGPGDLALGNMRVAG